jgi:Signal transduction histidine kinase
VKGSLSRRLVRRTTALVALVTIVLTIFISLANFQILQQQLDERLENAAGRPGGRTGTTTTSPNGPADPAGSGLIRIDLLTGVGYQITTGPDALTTQVAEQLLQLETGNSPVSVEIPELGLYRVLVRTSDHGRTVVALPYRDVTNPLYTQLIMTGLLTLGAILLAYLGTRQIVATSLRPLNRLAATANQVSALPLARGEGAVPIRVAAADANPETEVGQVGLALNLMLDNVEGALAERHRSETKVRRFVADASHELRNPLASIRGYAELTRRSSESLPPDASHALGRIEAESERMSALVQDLLLLARLDSEPTLDLRPTDLTEMVLNAVDDARAADREHHWALNLPNEEILANVDPHRTHQVIVNLLANARTHTPAGTHVEASLRREDGWAVVAVTDDGPGVPPEIQDSVFERFTRADVSRARQSGGSSTGLGLAIVAAVVGAQGGQVGLDSRPGHTCFTVRLPLA